MGRFETGSMDRFKGMPMETQQKGRCPWAGIDPDYVHYHDTEWGVPVHDDTRLFEALILDGFQAGLSWLTILKKRENYRRVFDGFDAQKMATYGKDKIETLMADSGIVRNRLKIKAAVKNAQAFLKVCETFSSFDAYLWQFVKGKIITNRWRSMAQVPAHTPQSAAMSKDLKQRGFSFVGPTICYAFMQAVGMVNDHLVTCYRHGQVGGKGGRI